MPKQMTSHRRRLYNGSMLYVNRSGQHVYVDIFAGDSVVGDDPVYHACYTSWEEAMEDALSWREWPLSV